MMNNVALKHPNPKNQTFRNAIPNNAQAELCRKVGFLSRDGNCHPIRVRIRRVSLYSIDCEIWSVALVFEQSVLAAVHVYFNVSNKTVFKV